MSRYEGTVGHLATILGDRLGRTREMSPARLQRIISSGHQFRWMIDQITELVVKLGTENPYFHEQTVQTGYYPLEWRMPRADEQLAALVRLFPGIFDTVGEGEYHFDQDTAFNYVAGADGIGIWPHLEFLGRHFNVSKPYTSGYPDVVRYLLELLQQECERLEVRFEAPKELMPLRIYTPVRRKLEELATQSFAMVNAFPISFGQRYATYSQRNVRAEAKREGWLPLCSADGICLLLLTPERLTWSGNVLQLSFAGDEADFSRLAPSERVPHPWSGTGSLQCQAGGIAYRFNATNWHANGQYSSPVAYIGRS